MSYPPDPKLYFKLIIHFSTNFLCLIKIEIIRMIPRAKLILTLHCIPDTSKLRYLFHIILHIKLFLSSLLSLVQVPVLVGIALITFLYNFISPLICIQYIAHSVEMFPLSLRTTCIYVSIYYTVLTFKSLLA